MRIIRIVFLWPVVMLAACAPALKEAPPQIGEIKVPSPLVRGNPAVTPVSKLDMHEWWSIFDDQQLNKLLEIGIRDNPGLAEAKARIGEAQAQIVMAGAKQLPHLDTADDMTRMHRSDNGDHAIYNGKTYTVANINPLMLSYRIDLFGQEQENVDMAQAGTEAARASYKESQLLLRAAIIKTYFALKTAGWMLNKQDEVIRLAVAGHAVMRAAYRAGLESSSRAIAQNASIAGEKAKLSALRQRQQALHFALAALLGKGPDYDAEINAIAPGLPPTLPVPENLGLDTLSQRPDIERALWQVKYFLHAEISAQKAFYPNINLRALIGLNSIGLNSLLSTGSATYAIGPAVSLPIFDGGTLKGRFAANAAAYEASIYAYNQAVFTAARQVATGLADMDNTRQMLADKEEALSQMQAYARVAAAEYRAGLNDQSAEIGATTKLNQAEMSLMETRLQWLAAMTDLATSVGGEFQGVADVR